MKISITFKDPDGVSNAIDQVVLDAVSLHEGLDEEERDCIREHKVEKVEEGLKKWLRYSEYVTIEFDLDAQTATVRPA